MEWARILAFITGTVDQELLLRNEYLAAENRIRRGQLKGRLRLSDAERAKLGEIGHRLGRRHWARWRMRPYWIPPWHGTEGSSLVSSMAQGHVEPRAGRGSTEKLRN
jgi:urease accessory protein UreE